MKLFEKSGYFSTAAIASKKVISITENQKEGSLHMSKDEKLIRSLKQGDTKALEKFIGKYNRYVSSIIGRIIGGRESDCEELTADVFIIAWNNRDKLQAEKITSYLGKIARNKAFDLLRQDKDALPLEDDILIYDKEDIAEVAEQKDRPPLLLRSDNKNRRGGNGSEPFHREDLALPRSNGFKGIFGEKGV